MRIDLRKSICVGFCTDFSYSTIVCGESILITKLPRLNAVPVQAVKIESGFWGERQAVNRDRTIPAIHHQMDITGRIDAWHLNWQPGQPKPHIFWDSDAGKWIEAVAYSLMTHPNLEFERQVDATIDLIEQAQKPDGYLNIWFTSVEPEKRWTNLRDWHELYDAGHLIEAAVAYAEATGKRKLLDVLCRYADLIDSRYGAEPDKRHGYPGHPELELALVKLYRATGEERYLKLSKYFVDERGKEPNYFDQEAKERGDDPAKFWAQTYNYCQAHKPIREQTEATGHAVRANYLYAGVADVALETDDAELVEVCRRLWTDLTEHEMYITGGLGPAHSNEGFTFAYDLPNETAYAETCAAISLVFFAERMFRLDPDSRYIDVMERALYNGMISGVSFEGDTFFYANPLSSYPKVNPFQHFSGITSDLLLSPLGVVRLRLLPAQPRALGVEPRFVFLHHLGRHALRAALQCQPRRAEIRRQNRTGRTADRLSVGRQNRSHADDRAADQLRTRLAHPGVVPELQPRRERHADRSVDQPGLRPHPARMVERRYRQPDPSAAGRAHHAEPEHPSRRGTGRAPARTGDLLSGRSR